MEKDFNDKQEIKIPIDKTSIDKDIIYFYFIKNDVIKYSEEISHAGGLITPVMAYKDTDDLYKIVNGQKRFWGMKYLKEKEIKAIIIPKPANKKEKIYLRLIDNVNMPNVIKETIETYIFQLIELEESFSTIANKINRTPSYIREYFYAFCFRREYGEYFNKEGINLTTKECYFLRKINLEDVNLLIKNIKRNPKEKGFYINELVNKINKRKDKEGNEYQYITLEDIVNKIHSDDSSIERNIIKTIIISYHDLIVNEAARNNRISIRGWGTFRRKILKETHKSIRNEKIDINKRYSLKFFPVKSVIETMNGIIITQG